MTQLGVRLTLLLGPSVPVPAPAAVLEALDRIEITHSDRPPSGIQIVLKAGRSGVSGILDYPLLMSPQLRPWSRVIVVVTFGVVPHVLFDGFLTHQQLAPGREPGSGTLTLTGEDVSVMMDLEERSAEHPAQDETIIANKLIATYAQYGLIPQVIPPVVLDPPIPIDRIPVQQGTDRQYLVQMAERHGYVFHVTPGPVPGVNTAYWGPPQRLAVPQSALSVNLGYLTNVESLDFEYDALAPALVAGSVQDRLTNQAVPVQTVASLRLPPLVSQPALLVNQPNVRTTQLRASGLNAMQAFGRAQGRTDASTDRVVVARGELDAVRYGGLLRARGVVGVRGAGYSYDGFYYVQSVTHKIRPGELRQSFTLTREGLGSLTPAVVP